VSYTKTNWTDNVTPISAANMNKIEQGIVDTGLNAPALLAANSTVVPTTADLDNYVTAGNFHYLSSSALAGNILHIPKAEVFTMQVAVMGATIATQTWRGNNTGTIYYRLYFGGVWGNWIKQLDPADFATQAETSLGSSTQKIVTPASLRGQSIASTHASDSLRASADTELSITDGPSVYTKKKAFRIITGGTYRVKFALRESNMPSIYGRIYKNGVAFGTERTTSTGLTTFSEDLVFAAGDTCELWVKGGGAGTGYLSNFRLYFNVDFVMTFNVAPIIPTLTYGT